MANPNVIQTSNNALNFMNELQGQQNTAFQGNQNALNAVSQAWAPVMQSGQIPYGYSPGLDSLLRSNIIQQGATATTNAENAAQLQERQASGGAMGPTGASQAINAEIGAQGQQSTAQALAQEREAGYNQGVQNLQSGTQAELGVASGENETGLAGASTGAGNLALNSATAQWQENQSTGPLATIGKVLGDVSGGIGAVTGLSNVAALFNPNGGSSGGYNVNPTTSVSAAGFNPTTGVFGT